MKKFTIQFETYALIEVEVEATTQEEAKTKMDSVTPKVLKRGLRNKEIVKVEDVIEDPVMASIDPDEWAPTDE